MAEDIAFLPAMTLLALTAALVLAEGAAEDEKVKGKILPIR